MKKQIALLVELQEKDRFLDQLREKILDGPRRVEEIEKRVRSAEANIESHRTRIEELEKNQRLSEAEIEDGVAHVRKSRGRLMSISNNKEYRALLREIEDTERENAAREDKLLEFLEELERVGEQLKGEQEALAVLRGRAQEEKAAIEEEVARTEEAFSAGAAEKEQLVQAIDGSLLMQYDKIKSRGGGLALAAVNNATCSACHMSIPPQLYNELQRQDNLQLCPHCQRLIYWKGDV